MVDQSRQDSLDPYVAAEDSVKVEEVPLLPIMPPVSVSRSWKAPCLVYTSIGCFLCVLTTIFFFLATIGTIDGSLDQLRQPLKELQAAGQVALDSTPFSRCGISSSLLNEFGSDNFRLSQVHVGSGYRIRKVLEKAARGEKLTIGLLGGSVSLGHGTDPESGQRNKYGAVPLEQQWHHFVIRYIQHIFPGAQHEFRLGAKAATDSTFFEWCWASLIGTDLDLIMIEMAVNDDYYTSFDSSETLLRSLLLLDSQPAVIYVDSFSPLSASAKPSILNAQDIQSTLSPFYDVAQISARPALLPAMIEDPTLVKPFFLGDERHVSARVHRFLGSMVVGYLMEERCRLSASVRDVQAEGIWSHNRTLGEVPKVRMTEKWDADVLHPTIPPRCEVAGGRLKPVMTSMDWKLVSWRYSKYYYEATRPGSSEIAFEVIVDDGAIGSIAVSYLRSRSYNLGQAICTVDGQEAVLDGYWSRSTSLAQTSIIASDVAPGRYEVTCRTAPPGGDSERRAFRLMGVMSV
ncbi:hypothetical protein JCM10908_000717 [Rhodotorula pacifica]|uniref:uncharacterized protein n=1 Tax=Rhodotorula pacifica TaxID=1495444 RepID=UPI00316FFC41